MFIALLLIIYYLPFTPYHLLLIIYFIALLLIIYYLPFTTYHLLLTIYSLSYTPYHLLLIIYFIVLLLIIYYTVTKLRELAVFLNVTTPVLLAPYWMSFCAAGLCSLTIECVLLLSYWMSFCAAGFNFTQLYSTLRNFTQIYSTLLNLTPKASRQPLNPQPSTLKPQSSTL